MIFLLIFNSSTQYLSVVYPDSKCHQIKQKNSSFLFGSVALNFQTAGEGMDLNDGLFSQNGGCGYVLKPSFMREKEERFDPEMPQKRDDYHPVILTIQVETTETERRLHSVMNYLHRQH